MRFKEIWREGIRNHVAGSSRGIIAFVAFLAVVISLGGIIVRGVVDVAIESDDFRQSGASTFRIDAPRSIDPKTCDALSEVDGVEASGATRKGEDLRFAILPDLPTPYFDVSAGMLELLDAVPAEPNSGIIIDSELSDLLSSSGRSTKTYLLGSTLPVNVSGIFEHPDDGRDATLNGAALGMDLRQDSFDSCWVRFWPPTENPLELLSLSMSAHNGTSEAVQWNPTLGRFFDAQGAFEGLPLVYLTAVAALVSAVLAHILVRLRRLELASARHAGVTLVDLVWVVFAEAVLWLVPACIIALTTFLFFSVWNNPDPFLSAWLAGVRVVGVSAAAWILSSAVTTALTGEKHLVRYFQQR